MAFCHLCLNEKHVKTQLELSNLPAVKLQYPLKFRKQRKKNKIVAIINLAEYS